MMHTQSLCLYVVVALVALYGVQASNHISFAVGLHQEDVTPNEFKNDRNDFTKVIQKVVSTRLGISESAVENVVFSAWRPKQISWGAGFIHEPDSSVDPPNLSDSYVQFTVDFWTDNMTVNALTYSNQLQMMVQTGAMTTAIQTAATGGSGGSSATDLQTSSTDTSFYNYNKFYKRNISVKLTGTEIAGLCVGAALCFALLAVVIAWFITVKSGSAAPAAANKETELV